LSEEKTEQLEEKEEKRKIKVISEIDDKTAIQGQMFMKGQLKEALDLAYQIIDLAKTEDLNSFIREQEELIARIKGIQEQREEKKRAKIRLELVSELLKVEKEYNIALKAGDFSKVEQFIREAKKILFQSDNEKLKIRWVNFEKDYLDKRARKEIAEDITKLIQESPELRKQFLFEDLKLRLTYLMQQVQEKELTEYMDKLEEIRTETIAAEDFFREVKNNIEELKEMISTQKSNKEYEKAISNCESLIQQATSIKFSKEVEEFSQLLIQLREDLKFEELKKSILDLNNQGLDLLKKGEIQNSLKKYESIRDSLKNWI